MQFASIGSGSKGNGTLVRAGDTTLLIDCGFSVNEVLSRLQSLDVSAGSITAILVTHEHGDHIGGVSRLARHLGTPVYLTAGTLAAVQKRGKGMGDSQLISAHEAFECGDIRVRPVAVPHDAREPVQFVLQYGQKTLGILTDLGSITPHVQEQYRACDALLLESNHCVTMLATGNYPPALKQRVGGPWGHLNNHQAAQFVSMIDASRLQHLVLAHLSAANNTVERVQEQMEPHIQDVDNVVYARQDQGMGWLTIV